MEDFKTTLINAAGTDQRANQYKAYRVNSSNAGILITSATQAPYGILQNRPESGNRLTVLTEGVTKMYAGASITFNDPLKLTTAGTFTTANSGDRAYGRAQESVNSGNHFWGMFYGSLGTTLTS